MKLTQQQKNGVAAIILLVLMGTIIAIISSYSIRNKKKTVELDNTCINCAQLFTDDVKTQEQAYANGEGIAPQNTNSDIKALFEKGKLIKLENANHYIIEKLTHSVAYVHPKVKSFMDEFSKSYHVQCEGNKIKSIPPLVITSLTRSQEDVKKLQSVNANAIENSGHLRGKTLDISYRHFGSNKEAKQIFIQTLSNLHKQGKCYAKYERNGCIHITVR